MESMLSDVTYGRLIVQIGVNEDVYEGEEFGFKVKLWRYFRI